MNRSRNIVAALVVACLLVLALMPLQLTTFAKMEGGDYIVTRLDDPSPGGCSPGDCSLREALNAAGGGAGSVVTFAVTGTVELTQPDQLYIYGTTHLQGSGADSIIIDRNGVGAVLFVVENPPNPAPNCSPTVSGVTITGGANTTMAGGVAVESDCSVTIRDSIIRDNSSQHHGGGVGGGGSDPRGISIINSAVISNSASDGGGIYLSSNGLLENVTLSGNSAANIGGGLAVGPFEPAGGTYSTTLRSVTIANNTAAVGDGLALIEVNPPQNTHVYLYNSIFADTTTSACATVGFNTLQLTSIHFNLATDQSCMLSQPTDMEDTNPQLPALQGDGGTYVHIPSLFSPALDSGEAGTLPTDQRGLPRPVDLPGIPNTADGADRGAYEHQTTPPTAVTLGIFATHADDKAWIALVTTGIILVTFAVAKRRRDETPP